MRRAGLGEGASAGSYGYTNSGYSVYEEENERLTESLRTKVSAIKSLSIEIGTEVKNQNKMLSEMDNDFDSAGGLLGATMGRLRTLSRGSQTKLLCYMMLFALFVFFVIYWIIKLRVPVYLFGNSAAFKGLYLCGEHHENKKWRSHHFGLARKASQALPGVFCWTTCSDYLHLTY